jgi:hypothetical protein
VIRRGGPPSRRREISLLLAQRELGNRSWARRPTSHEKWRRGARVRRRYAGCAPWQAPWERGAARAPACAGAAAAARVAVAKRSSLPPPSCRHRSCHRCRGRSGPSSMKFEFSVRPLRGARHRVVQGGIRALCDPPRCFMRMHQYCTLNTLVLEVFENALLPQVSDTM